MNLPKDPAILLSYINTQLRDFYPSLTVMMTHKIMIAPPRRRNTYLVIVTILHKKSICFIILHYEVNFMNNIITFTERPT